LKKLKEIDLSLVFSVFFKHNCKIVGFEFFLIFLVIGKILALVSFFELFKVLEKEPQIHMNKFELIFLETDRRIVVLARVMQEEMFDFSAERFGLGSNFLFHLKSFLKLRVLLQIFKIVDLEL
jgi:hypothetical protein